MPFSLHCIRPVLAVYPSSGGAVAVWGGETGSIVLLEEPNRQRGGLMGGSSGIRHMGTGGIAAYYLVGIDKVDRLDARLKGKQRTCLKHCQLPVSNLPLRIPANRSPACLSDDQR